MTIGKKIGAGFLAAACDPHRHQVFHHRTAGRASAALGSQAT